MSSRKLRNLNKIPTRSGLQRKAGSGGDTGCTRLYGPHTLSDPCRSKEGPTYRAKVLTFRVGADEDPDAATGGYQVRGQGGEIAGERRPPERGVPGTGQLGARTGWPHRPVGGKISRHHSLCSSGP